MFSCSYISLLQVLLGRRALFEGVRHYTNVYPKKNVSFHLYFIWENDFHCPFVVNTSVMYSVLQEVGATVLLLIAHEG